MPTMNNMLNVKVSQISSAGKINFGCSININPQSDVKSVGGSSPIGDFPRNVDFERNVYIDPDIGYDQGGNFL